MQKAFEVLVPLLNPNETEARLVSLTAVEGQSVESGDAICTLETTKSAAEILADSAGYVVGLHAVEGDVLRAGERLCWLAPDADWEAPEIIVQPGPHHDLPAGLRITDPALALAQAHALDLGTLPTSGLVTEAIVREFVGADPAGAQLPDGPYAENALIIYGGGGHGKSVLELVLADGRFAPLAVLDDGMQPGKLVLGVPVVGGGGALVELKDRGLRWGANAVGGIGDVTSRVRIFDKLQDSGLECPTLFHPSAVVEPSAKLALGCQVFPLVYIGSSVDIGYGVIVNTSAVVSHDCRIEPYANVAPGALLAGGVQVGEKALIGMGVTIHLNVSIGAGARIGNSAVVKQDVPAGMVVRAGAVWPG